MGAFPGHLYTPQFLDMMNQSSKPDVLITSLVQYDYLWVLVDVATTDCLMDLQEMVVLSHKRHPGWDQALWGSD